MEGQALISVDIYLSSEYLPGIFSRLHRPSTSNVLDSTLDEDESASSRYPTRIISRRMWSG
jgi:hypothetical protein